MNAKITPSKICGEVVAPPSKSYAHRILIAAYLTGQKVSVRNVGNSNDVYATLNALQSLGAEITSANGVVAIERKSMPKHAVVDCNESGSTLRFLLPIVSALGVNATFTGQGRLLARPIQELVDALNANGADIDGLTIRGKLRAGQYRIPANISSQYITGLLFALPLLDGDSEIIFVGEAVSQGYIDITLDVLRQFGIQINTTNNGYVVKGNQVYTPPTDITVEGDYSGAAFILSLGAICGNVRVKGLNARSMQGDAEIVKILEKFGAKVTVEGNCVSVVKNQLLAVDIDCENIPDLVQIISVVASYAHGVTTLRNVSRLRLKESDRVQAILDQLTEVGICCDYVDGALHIHGGKPIGTILSGGNDHRTVMSATVLSLGANGASEVVGVDPVNKSYTDFYNDISKLGGQINVDV